MTGVYTVSQINHYIGQLFSRDYALKNICIRGEISNCKYHTSGHIYFTLKDAGAALSCVMFARERAGLSFRLLDGQEVEARGQIAVYEKGGSFQLYAREIALSGRGALYERFLMLREKLQEMGMFDACYKKPIPPYAMRIGVVTAPTGAAIQDICNITRRRNPYAELVLYPALVQGEGAKESIVRGIRKLDSMGLDVLIVGRGGGSIEDLWAFNEECVAKAIFDAKTPIISAVGHETDFTIADFAADLRAPTPSAAAELANFEYDVFLEQLKARRTELSRELSKRVLMLRQRLYAERVKLRSLSPKVKLSEKRRLLSDRREALYELLSDRIEGTRLLLSQKEAALGTEIEGKLLQKKHRLALFSERLHGLSPLLRLSAGYSYLSDESGRALRRAAGFQENEVFYAYLADGRVRAKAERIELSERRADEHRADEHRADERIAAKRPHEER